MKSIKYSKGMSLIEILIVVAIIGLLTLALSFLIVPQLQKAKDSRRKIDLYEIKNAIEEYYDTYNCFPVWLPTCSSSFKIGETVLIREMPCDPKTKLSYVYVTDGTTCSNQYELYTDLENKSDADIERLSCESGCGPSCDYNYGVSSTNRSLQSCSE